MKHEPISSAPEASGILADYTPVPLRARRNGWTAERQRIFLAALAETGCVSQACLEAGITARSAHRLRAHPEGAAFARAWDLALRAATGKLVTIAFERALRGGHRELWRDGKLVAEARQPSDKLLMYLLGSLAPIHHEQGTRWAKLHMMADEAGKALSSLTAGLADSAVPADPLTSVDFEATPPEHAHDPLVPPFEIDEEGCAYDEYDEGGDEEGAA